MILYACMVKMKRDWKRVWKRPGQGLLNPIHHRRRSSLVGRR